jgi:large subunit ribosomal protein L53
VSDLGLSKDWADIRFTEDGKELDVDLKGTSINELVDQVDRHSRMLARKEDLSG